MRLSKRFFTGFASLLVGVAIGVGFLSGEPPERLEALNYQDSAGHTLTLNPAEAKLTVLHFWATWCTPCVAELPELDKFQAEYKEKGLRVLPLSLDAPDAKKVEKFYRDNKITALPALYDPKSQTMRIAKGNGVPTSIFIDSRGRVVARVEGVLEWGSEGTKARVEKMLAK